MDVQRKLTILEKYTMAKMLIVNTEKTKIFPIHCGRLKKAQPFVCEEKYIKVHI